MSQINSSWTTSTRRFPLVALILCAACGGAGTGARSVTIRMQGPDCRMACSAQLHPGEVLTDCTPPLDFEPTRRDPSSTTCFFGPASNRAVAPDGSAR